jgi:hypothetical protein
VRSTSALALLVLLAQGCVSGHLLDAARTRERLRVVHGATVEAGEVRIDYDVTVTDDAGRPVGDGRRAAAIELEDLRGPAALAIRSVRPPAEAPQAPGICAPHPSGTVLCVEHRDRLLLLRDPESGEAYPPLSARAFTRVRTAPWVYPLLPLTLAIDAVVTPALLLTAPAPILIGE